MKKSCLVLVAIAAIALVAIAAFVFIRLPALTKAATVPLTVSITGPDNGGAYPVSAGLQLRGEAISGAPISRMELWADGTLKDSAQVPEQGLYVFGHTWTWTPQTLGDHTLVVRAFDAKDQVSPSTVLHIRAIPDPGMVLVITAGAGDTLESLAHANGTTVEAILSLNPNLDPKAPLSGDIFVPANPPAASGTSGVS